MHPAQYQALSMLLNQLHAAATQQVATIQHLRQLFSSGAQTAQRQPAQQPMPQMPDFLNPQEEALLSQGIAASAQQSAQADGNEFSQHIGQFEQALGGISPHFARPQQRVAQQRRPLPGQAPQQMVANGDPFGGMFDAMGFGG